MSVNGKPLRRECLECPPQRGEGCDKLDRINNPEPLWLRGKDLQDEIKIVACGRAASPPVEGGRAASPPAADSLWQVAEL
ncbi:hypothetical protein [Sedimentisphaera salicampi]|uniref:hypothetical protein n=1 Tax=Sedimentisphaera salicampi TaxID=1941349 RepID=UPI000B9BAE95|nr:hypothetical protein [Sedimentisphaera salicampi]